MVIDMNMSETNNGGKQTGRRKSCPRKKNKQPQRGLGVEQLERLRLQDWTDWWKKMTEIPSLHPIPCFNEFTPSSSVSTAVAVAYTTSSSCPTFPNAGVQFRYGYPPVAPPPTPAPIMFNETGSNPIRFENSKPLSSIPNYIKCASDGCGVCHKKIRTHHRNNVSQSRYFAGSNHNVVEMNDPGKSRFSHQVTEYDFLSGESRSTTTSSWCGSLGGGEVSGLHSGEGSCVTAITEGSVSSVDLSLKLSY